MNKNLNKYEDRVYFTFEFYILILHNFIKARYYLKSIYSENEISQLTYT